MATELAGPKVALRNGVIEALGKLREAQERIDSLLAHADSLEPTRQASEVIALQWAEQFGEPVEAHGFRVDQIGGRWTVSKAVSKVDETETVQSEEAGGAEA